MWACLAAGLGLLISSRRLLGLLSKGAEQPAASFCGRSYSLCLIYTAKCINDKRTLCWICNSSLAVNNATPSRSLFLAKGLPPMQKTQTSLSLTVTKTKKMWEGPATPPSAPTLAVKARKILRRPLRRTEERTENSEGESCRELSFRVEYLCGLAYKLPQRRVHVLCRGSFRL